MREMTSRPFTVVRCLATVISLMSVIAFINLVIPKQNSEITVNNDIMVSSFIEQELR